MSCLLFDGEILRGGKRVDFEGLENLEGVQPKLAVGLVVGCVGVVVVVLFVCGFCGCGDGGIEEGSDRGRN